MGAQLDAAGAGQVLPQEGGVVALAAPDLVVGHDGVGQEGLGLGVVRERDGGPFR